MSDEAEPAAFTPGPWRVTNEEYHADRECVSHSALEVFRESRPLYHGVYVTGELPRRGPTPAMLLGSAVHALLFEAEWFTGLFAVAPEDIDRRTKAGKAAWEAFQAEAAGKTVLTADQAAAAKAMAAGVRRNPMAAKLLDAPGRSEFAVRWRDGDTGIRLKCKPDRVLDCGILLDAKSCDDPTPEAFARTVANFGYHRQAALYLEGARHAPWCEAADFIFVAVGSRPPHECVCYSLDGEALSVGRAQNQQLLGELAECRKKKQWGSRHEGQVVACALPKWAATTVD